MLFNLQGEACRPSLNISNIVAWDTGDSDEILTSLSYPWVRCDPVWRSGKVLDRTSRGTDFNSTTGPDFFTISIQCVFVSQCFIINLINYLTGLYHLFWSSHALFGVSHCLRLAKVNLIGHPQIFLEKKYQKLQIFDQTIFLNEFAKNPRVSVFTHKCIWIIMKCKRLSETPLL